MEIQDLLFLSLRRSCEGQWVLALAISLNWLAGFGSLGEMTRAQSRSCLSRETLKLELEGMFEREETFPVFEWSKFFKAKSINYWGEEVKVSRWFRWENEAPALPDDCIGVVKALDVCTAGIRHFIQNPESYMTDAASFPQQSPKVMVSSDDWPKVAKGLLDRGVCGLIAEDEINCVGGCKVLGGLFGVSKDEWTGDVEIFRLIMNFVPLNTLFVPLSGDLATLPAISQFVPIYLGQEEILLTSSEDIRCMFYIIALPENWYKYLAFSRQVPHSLCPADGRRYYLHSKVLPMGFVHSVAIAQHIHRNLVLNSHAGEPRAEMRAAKGHSNACPAWRGYLDNFDELEQVDRRNVSELAGSMSTGIARFMERVCNAPRPAAPEESCRTQLQSRSPRCIVGWGGWDV